MKSSEVNLSQAQKNTKHRMYVLKQWLQTQITYNEDLVAAIQNIKKPLQSQKLLSEDDIVRLFPEFQQMLNLSNNMIRILQTFKNIKNVNQLIIGKQLRGIISFYKIYLVYFKGQTKMKKILQELQTKNENKMRNIQAKLKDYFKNMYKNKDKNPKQNITIQDCLERPLYRLFKYHLLIESYLKKLPQSSPDFQQLKKCRQLFMKIQQQCNDSYTQMEKQQFKIKLQKLYGRNIPQNSRYINTMNASTLYFPCKLYIFSNVIIISKAETMIGYRQEKLYLNMGLDQFSFVAYKKDTKYFKNILTLCGIYDCVHFFSSDKGTRLEIFQSVSKIITDQKLKALSKRQHRQPQTKGKLTFLMDTKSSSVAPMLPGFKIQVIDIDIRTLSYFSNDSVYIVRFSIPEYIDDEATYMKNAKIKIKQKTSLEGRDSLTKQQHLIMSKIQPLPFKSFQKDSEFMKSQHYNSINQYIQIHLDQVIQLHKILTSEYPSIRFPQIDPFSKDINFYSQNKKKTKSFEVRTFLIDQFLNFIFRHPQIMAFPMEIIKKLRIQQNLWQYVVDRNTYLLGSNNKKQNIDQGNKYNDFHCELCKKSMISSIEQFQTYRTGRIKAIFKQKQKFCFNFYNLLRNNFLGLNPSQFNNLQRILLYINYFQGRFDYTFLFKKQIAAKHKNVKIMLASLDENNKDNQKNIFFKEGVIKADYKSTVGMVINQISRDIQIYNMLDFRIVLTSIQSQRILDQDQFLYDVIQSSQLQYNEGVSEVGSVIRNSEIREDDTFQQQDVGFFTKIRNMMPTIINKPKPVLYLRKIVFLPLQLQIQALKNNSQRAEIVTYQIFSKISQLKVSLTLNIWGQLCGLYYCVRIKNQISKFTKDNIKQFSKIVVELLPKQKSDYIKNKIFAQSAIKIILNFQKDNQKMQNPLQYKFKLYRSILQRSYQHCMVNTYFVPVQAKTVPIEIIIDGKLKLEGQCYLGVNDNQVIVIRSKQDMAPAVCIKIQQIQIVHSAYSVFLTYKRLSRLTFNEKDGQKNEVQQFDLRFDAKMLHGFVELFQKYRLIKLKFGGSQFSQIIF